MGSLLDKKYSAKFLELVSFFYVINRRGRLGRWMDGCGPLKWAVTGTSGGGGGEHETIEKNRAAGILGSELTSNIYG